MLTISKPLSTAQATKYYNQEYASAAENYYQTGQAEGRGEWHGRLGDELNLTGAVDEVQFARLCEGQHPASGAQLVKHNKPVTYENQYGDMIEAVGHRAGWDATFSAPKSISLAAIAGGDERVVAAHRESVDAALDALEEFTQARIGGDKAAETTGKMIAAKFEHTAARPDRLMGYAAPQLHTHTVVFNLTETADGKIKPLDTRELFRSQRYATEIYRISLAEKLQKLGYEIEIDSRTGAPEIKGFSAEYIKDSSPRSEDVKAASREIKERIEQAAGQTVDDGAGLRQAAAKLDRAGKDYDKTEMLRRVEAMEAKHGFQARNLRQQSLERGAIEFSQDEIKKRAAESVTFARENAMEREAVADKRQILADALRRNSGLTTFEAVTNQYRAREACGEFIEIYRRNEQPQATTEKMLRLEQDNLDRMLAGRDKFASLLPESNAGITIERIAAEKGLTLNKNQTEALQTLIQNRDQVFGLQGRAGTGKTTALSVFKEIAEADGYEVKGLAPTTRAAKELGKSGIESETLAKCLSRKHTGKAVDLASEANGLTAPNKTTAQLVAAESKAVAPRLYVLDESSLASTKAINGFLSKLGGRDRVLLVGDAAQHEAVEAGTPFAQLQRGGLKTAEISEIVRQREPGLRQTVERLSLGETRAAVENLQAAGQVVEIKDAAARRAAVAADFCRNPANTLAISPANRERQELNRQIHDYLRDAGAVGAEDFKFKVLVGRNEMTGTERTFANAYRADEDIIHFNRSSKVYGVEAGEYGRVSSINHKENLLSVEMSDGRNLTYNPGRFSGVSVYGEEERFFAAGERIQFRAPFNEQKIANGELGTVQQISGSNVSIKLEDNRLIQFDAEKFQHLDYGYAVTSYSSQGQTIDRVLVNADTAESAVLLNQRMAYVSLSRAREEATVYTNNADGLSQAFSRQTDKHSALEAVAEVKPRTIENADLPKEISATQEISGAKAAAEAAQATEVEAAIGFLL